MAKPEWLINHELKQKLNKPKYKTCGDCQNLGKYSKMIKYKDQEWTELYECAIHPGCFNTVYSIACEDIQEHSMI